MMLLAGTAAQIAGDRNISSASSFVPRRSARTSPARPPSCDMFVCTVVSAQPPARRQPAMRCSAACAAVPYFSPATAPQWHLQRSLRAFVLTTGSVPLDLNHSKDKTKSIQSTVLVVPITLPVRRRDTPHMGYGDFKIARQKQNAVYTRGQALARGQVRVGLMNDPVCSLFRLAVLKAFDGVDMPIRPSRFDPAECGNFGEQE